MGRKKIEPYTQKLELSFEIVLFEKIKTAASKRVDMTPTEYIREIIEKDLLDSHFLRKKRKDY